MRVSPLRRNKQRQELHDEGVTRSAVLFEVARRDVVTAMYAGQQSVGLAGSFFARWSLHGDGHEDPRNAPSEVSLV